MLLDIVQGEKLYEELLLNEEGMQSTEHDKIFIGKPVFTDYKLMLKSIESLKEIIDDCDNETLKDNVQQIVPTYNISNTENTITASNRACEVWASKELI